MISGLQGPTEDIPHSVINERHSDMDLCERIMTGDVVSAVHTALAVDAVSSTLTNHASTLTQRKLKYHQPVSVTAKRESHSRNDPTTQGNQSSTSHSRNCDSSTTASSVASVQHNVSQSRVQPPSSSSDNDSNQAIQKEREAKLWVVRTYLRYARYMNNRARPGHAYVPTVEEHFANIFTHGLLVLPSVFAMWWMVRLASNNLQHGIAVIYGVALFVLFAVSTTFHALSYSGKLPGLKNFFHIGDRAVIYIFIAASYTPWLMLKDYDGWGGCTLCVVWIAAMLGILYQYTFHEQYKWLETLLYLLIGVCPSIVCLAMKEKSGMFELAFGGSIYISGVIFFKCDGLIPFAHAIWHCFVTLGAVCHYQAVCTYLLGNHNEYSHALASEIS